MHEDPLKKVKAEPGKSVHEFDIDDLVDGFETGGEGPGDVGPGDMGPGEPGTTDSVDPGTRLAPGSTVVIVDSNGQFVGTGTVDTDGTIVQDQAETTVIMVPAAPVRSPSSAPGSGPTDSMEPVDGDGHGAIGGSGPLQPTGGFVGPAAFTYRPDPGDPSRQTTDCVTVRFGYGLPLPGGQLPHTIVDVRVLGNAPVRTSNGRPITPAEAALRTTVAANLAGRTVTMMLDDQVINSPQEIQAAFQQIFSRNMLLTGDFWGFAC